MAIGEEAGCCMFACACYSMLFVILFFSLPLDAIGQICSVIVLVCSSLLSVDFCIKTEGVRSPEEVSKLSANK